jgi:tight adherence protein B
MDSRTVLAIAFTVSSTLIAMAFFFAGRSTGDETRMAARFASLTSLKIAGALHESNGVLLNANAESGSMSIFDRLLGRVSQLLKLETLLRQADSRTTIIRLLAYCFAAGIGGAILLLTLLRNPAIAMLGALVSTLLPIILLRVRRARRIAAFDRSLPDAIEMMSRSLRAGHSMIAAISIVAEHAAEPAKAEFAEVFRKQNFGLPLRDALMHLLDRIPSHDLRLLVTGMLVQKDTGGNLAEILDRIVWVIRERLKIQGEIRIHTAQGRLTGWILCLMPVGLMIVLNIINPGYSKPLTEDPLGVKIFYGGIALLIFGAFLIKRIIDGIEV